MKKMAGRELWHSFFRHLHSRRISKTFFRLLQHCRRITETFSRVLLLCRRIYDFFPASTFEEEFFTSWISASVHTLSVAQAITILIRELQELSSESWLCSSDHQIFYKQERMVNFWMYAKGDQRLIIVSRNYLYRSWKCCQVCLLNSTPLLVIDSLINPRIINPEHQ
jgi:hypothetical protein